MNILIVGGGIMGAFHAYHAARAGHRVTILEKDSQPAGSTVQNFGQIVPSGLGADWFGYGVRSVEIYKELSALADFGLSSQGSLYVASDELECQLLSEVAQRHEANQYPSRWLRKADVLASYNFLQPDYVAAACLFEHDMSANPRVFIHRLLAYLVEQCGVGYYPATGITGYNETSEGVLLSSSAGNVFEADLAIVCSGYTSQVFLTDFLIQKELIVSKLHMMETVPMPEVTLRHNLLTGLTIRRYEAFQEAPSAALLAQYPITELEKLGIHILFKQEADGSIIIGDSHEYAPIQQIAQLGAHTETAIESLLLNEARRIVQFPVDKLQRRWAGFYAQHPSGMVAERLSNRLFIRTGIGGKGMSSSAGYAEHSLQVILEQLK